MDATAEDDMMTREERVGLARLKRAEYHSGGSAYLEGRRCGGCGGPPSAGPGLCDTCNDRFQELLNKEQESDDSLR